MPALPTPQRAEPNKLNANMSQFRIRVIFYDENKTKPQMWQRRRLQIKLKTADYQLKYYAKQT